MKNRLKSISYILIIIAFCFAGCSDSLENDSSGNNSQKTDFLPSERNSESNDTYNNYKPEQQIVFFDLQANSPIENNLVQNTDYLFTSLDGNFFRFIDYSVIDGESTPVVDICEPNGSFFYHEGYFKDVLESDYYNKDSTRYSSISKDQVIFKYLGEWTIPNDSVTYINYSLDDRYTPKQEWIEYFDKVLLEKYGVTDSPIFISESWKFNFNGLECYGVNAINMDMFFEYGGQIYPTAEKSSLPKGENLITYHLSAIFTEGYSPRLMRDSDFHNISKKTPVKSEDSFVNDYKGYSSREITALYSFQYNENNKIIRYPFYTSYLLYDRTRHMNTTYFLADVDANGVDEIIVNFAARGSQFSFTDIISLENGKFVYLPLYPHI